MTERTVRLTPKTIALEKLLLDPNNPRFARSLNLPRAVPDSEIPKAQNDVRNLFVNEKEEEVSVDDDDVQAEGQIRIGDLIRSMKVIGFVPIDRVVVRAIDSQASMFVVIEGNRRVSAAKYLYESKLPTDPEERRKHDETLRTLRELDVLVLETDGLSKEQLDDQIGVILGLRHFGSVLEWGTLAKAVNIYNEYMMSPPSLGEFRLDASRITEVSTRLSESRSNVISALKTYVAYQQMQKAFTHGGPKPSHYSLLQACVVNRKLHTSKFVEQNPNTFDLTPATLENLNTICQFETRDAVGDEQRILKDPKAVARFASIVGDASGHKDSAVRAFATALRDEVLTKERPLDDALDNLRSFKADRVWTEALSDLLKKVIEPADSSEQEVDGQRLHIGDFQAKGNDLLRLEEARKAFKNVRTILGIPQKQ